MNETLFTKIINGDIPSHKIYEDDATYAFLDIHPVTPGHVLVVPKQPVPYIWDLPPDEYQALMATVRLIGCHVRDTLAMAHVGVQVIGVDVPHAHIHIVPFNTTDEYYHRSDMASEPDHAALAAMAETLRLS
ncbi:MAG: HIT family protein [Candidatus Saccharimonadales bacterium]